MDVFAPILYMIRLYSKLALAGLITVSLSACLTQPSNETAQNSFDNSGDGVSVLPMFLCGEGRAVTSVAADGTVSCSAPTMKGLAAKDPVGGDASCSEGQTLEWLEVGDKEKSDPLMFPVCNEAENTNADSVTFGAGPAAQFTCPPGSVLKGFSEKGEPLCASIVGDEALNIALIMDAAECPWGMLSGEFEHEDFKVPVCISDGRAPRWLRLNGQYVTRRPSQNSQICKGDKVVVGFTEDHDLICKKGAAGFRKKPSRYWTTKYDGHAERPVCRKDYHPEPMLMKRLSGKGGLIKVWTCSRSI